jgi:hypothetical protein
MRWFLPILHIHVGQAVARRPALVFVAGAALLSDIDEAKRDQFTDGWGNSIVVDAPLDELIVGDDQSPVLGSPMGHVLFFKATHHSDCRQGQHSHRGACDHRARI